VRGGPEQNLRMTVYFDRSSSETACLHRSVIEFSFVPRSPDASWAKNTSEQMAMIA
jgi:hypothetical protein